MINLNSTLGTFSNIKITVRNALNSSNASKANSTNSSSNEVLGYKADKDGFFTSEFNEAAGISSNIKIHSQTMQKLVEQELSYKPFSVSLFKSIDIAKSVGNAYKLLSQVVGEGVLSSKDSFNADELENLPFVIQYNKSSLELTDTLSREKSTTSNINALLAQDEQNAFSVTKNLFLDGFFDSEIGGIRDANELARYTQDDGSISTGGVLLAFLNANLSLVEGETTAWGKMLGADRYTDAAALNQWFRQDQLQNMVVFGEQDFMKVLEISDLNEFKTQYKAHQKQKMQEESKNEVGGFDEAIKEAMRYLKLLLGEKIDNKDERKSLQEFVANFAQSVDIKA